MGQKMGQTLFRPGGQLTVFWMQKGEESSWLSAKKVSVPFLPRKLPPAAPKTVEREAWARGLERVAGVDEVGRGALAGPVVAAAVILPPEVHIPHVTDSKLLLPEDRERLAEEIIAAALSWAVGMAPAPLIDACNILRATHLAMREALRGMEPPPHLVLVDGRAVPDIGFPQRNIIGGDRRCFSIAAASIVAKVTRDRIMRHLDTLYPEYGLATHKGYSTTMHFEAIARHGASPVHRLSFSPFVERQQGELEFEE